MTADAQLVHVRFGSPEPVDDEVFDSLLRSIPSGEFGLDSFTGSREVGVTESSRREPPFGLGIARPRVLDIGKLYALAGKGVSSDVRASWGGAKPLLVIHGVAALHEAGRRPKGMWGMGYEATIDDAVSTTSIEPGTKVHTAPNVDQWLSVGVGVSGQLGVPQLVGGEKIALDAPIANAEIRTTTDAELGLAIDFLARALKIHARRAGAAATWQVYGQDTPLDGEQKLLQGVTVPADASDIRVTVVTWVRKRGVLGFGTATWNAEPITFELALD